MTTRPASTDRTDRQSGSCCVLICLLSSTCRTLCVRADASCSRASKRARAAACACLTVWQLDPENPPQGARHRDPVLRGRDSAHPPRVSARAKRGCIRSLGPLRIWRPPGPVCGAQTGLPSFNRCSLMPPAARACLFSFVTACVTAAGRLRGVRVLPLFGPTHAPSLLASRPDQPDRGAAADTPGPGSGSTSASADGLFWFFIISVVIISVNNNTRSRDWSRAGDVDHVLVY